MGTLKFRVWDTNPLPFSKSMLYMDDMVVETIKNYGVYIDRSINVLTYNNGDRYKIMRHIDRNDINNKEIYEGDILYDVNFARIPLVVKYSIPLSKFIIENRGYCINFTQLGKYEIIGNMYETPELLED